MGSAVGVLEEQLVLFLFTYLNWKQTPGVALVMMVSHLQQGCSGSCVG